MKLFADLKARARHMLWPIFWTSLIIYITFHILQGERGLIAYWHLREQIVNANQALAGLIQTKETLQNRVSLLSPKSLDLDLLEERARYLLGYSHNNEAIIIIR